MLLVKNHVSPSAIEGLGCFASEFVAKGAPIWEFVPSFDVALTFDEISQLPQLAQEFWKMYAYVSGKTGRHVLPVDNARFINHSVAPNVIDSNGRKNGEEINVASRDIHPGDELTVDYRTFDEPITFDAR